MNSLAQMQGSALELSQWADVMAIPGSDINAFLLRRQPRLTSCWRGRSVDARPGYKRATPPTITLISKRGLAAYDPPRGRCCRCFASDRRPVASLTFTSDACVRGGAGFFTCQHHYPENFWRPEYQRHANGALQVDSAVFVTRDPADFHEFLTNFTGQHDMLSTSLHVRFDLGQGSIDVLFRSPSRLLRRRRRS